MYVYLLARGKAPEEHHFESSWSAWPSGVDIGTLHVELVQRGKNLRRGCVLCRSESTDEILAGADWRKLSEEAQEDSGSPIFRELYYEPSHPHDGQHEGDLAVFGNGLLTVQQHFKTQYVVAVSECRLWWKTERGDDREFFGRQGSRLIVQWCRTRYVSSAVGAVLSGVDLNRIIINKSGGRGHLLKDANVSFLPGTVTAIVGKSGCGKTNLIKALSGKECATAGKVIINNMSYYDNMAKLRSCMAYLPQDDLLHADLTVLQELRYTAKLRCPKTWSSKERKLKIAAVVQDLEIYECLEKSVKELSGGQRKRVAIACALLAEPKVMFLDEPTSPLDPGMSAEFVYMVLANIARSGCTVIFVTHDLDTLTPEDPAVIGKSGLELVDQVIFVGEKNEKTEKFKGFVYYSGRLSNFDPADANKSDKSDKSDKSESQRVRDSFRKIKKCLGDKQGYEHVCGAPRLLTEKASPDLVEKGILVERAGGIRQFFINLSRGIRQRFNTPGTLLLQMAIPLVIGIIMGFVSDAEKLYAEPYFTKSMMFTYSAGAFFVGIFSSINAFSNRDLLAHEQYHGLKTVPYVLSVFVIQSAICAVQSGILYAVFTSMTGVVEHDIIQRGFDVFAVIYACAESAMVMGLLASAVFKNPMLVAPLLVLLQIVFSGIVFNLGGVAAKLSYLISCKWSLDGLGAISQLNDLFGQIGATSEVKDHYEASVQSLMLSLMWLWLISLLLLVVTMLVLVRRNARQFSASGGQTFAMIRGRLGAVTDRYGMALLTLALLGALAYLMYTGVLWAMFDNAREYTGELFDNLPSAWDRLTDDFSDMMAS